MQVEELTSSSFAEWDAYVNSHPDSTCYHDRAWQLVAMRAYQIVPRFLLARANSQSSISGILPLFQIGGLFSAHLSNGLFGAYAPILAENEWVRQILVGESQRILQTRKFHYLLLKSLGKPTQSVYRDFTPVNKWVIATLRLDHDPDRVWHSLRDKIRNCVRKALRYQLNVRDDKDQLRPFYDVLAENMHQKGAPAYGYEFMRNLVDAYGDRSELITIWNKEKIIAGALVLAHKKTSVVPFASARPNALHMNPNNLLYWEIIRRSCLKGMEVLDFGRSLRDSGSLAFKRGWGVEVIPQPCYVYSARGNNLDLDPSNRQVAWFVDHWRRLPRPLADRFGPMVCRQVAGFL